MSNEKNLVIPDELLKSKILWIRGKKVMLDKDLAELYGVTTKRLNEQVKRNSKRFPDDFMFKLTESEKDEVVAICDHLKSLKFSTSLPYAFTEHGAVMVASVLNSEIAIEVNIQIVRVFNKIREEILNYKDVLLKLNLIENKLSDHDKDLQAIFTALKKLLNSPNPPRERIGFKRKGEK